MRAIAAYMLNKSNERPEVYEPMPFEPEMRRRRDSHGRYMKNDGVDARAYDARPEHDLHDDKYGYVSKTPFVPDFPIEPYGGLYDGGEIGFGKPEQPVKQPVKREPERVSAGGRKMIRAGGTFFMQPTETTKSRSGEETLTSDEAQCWVDSMEYVDEAGREHHGGKWSMTDVKPFAQKMGIPTSGEQFNEFFAMMNAMYADYMAVARKFGITSPEFYASMAKAWMNDPDAVDGKTMLYYDSIVKKPE